AGMRRCSSRSSRAFTTSGTRRGSSRSRRVRRAWPDGNPFRSRARQPIHLDDDADEVLELDAVARLETRAGDGLRPHARGVKLLLRIVFVGEDDLPRNLAVIADRPNLFQDGVAGSFVPVLLRLPTLQHLVPARGSL